MSKILVVGVSISEARAVAHEVAESRGETMQMRDAFSSGEVVSDKHTYWPVNTAQVLNGYAHDDEFDEVYVLGSISAQTLQKIEAEVYGPKGAKPKVELFVQDETNTHFYAAAQPGKAK